MGNRKIAIIGAGPAGCLLARLLHLAGSEVTVFEGEAHSNFRSQGGTLDLHTATGLAALKEAKLFDEFLKYARYDGQYMAIVDKDLEYHLERNAVGKYNKIEERPEIDRSSLREILSNSLPEGMIKWGYHLKKVQGRSLVFEHTTVDGFDLIVGADGAWSKVRKEIDSSLVPKFAGIGMFELEITDAENEAPELSKLVNRGSIFASTDGNRTTIQQMGDGSLNIYCGFVTDNPDWYKPENCGFNPYDLKETKQTLLETRYKDWDPRLKQAIELANGRCNPRSLFMLPVGSKWEHKQGLTLIGDAAHLMTPYAGEGVNQALDDAMQLAKAINGAADKNDQQLDKAIKSFEEVMFARIGPIQELTWGLLQDWMYTPGAPKSVMANSQAPLITSHSDEEEELEYESSGSRSPVEAGKTGSGMPSTFVLALTFAAGISGLLFGYDTGVVSATLVSIGTSLSNRELTSMDKSIITSSTSLFALIISPFSSVLADRLGRKRVILYADILFIAGALLQAWSSTVPVMVAGRCIIGAGVGAASFVVPLYIAEVAPAAHRGRLVTLNIMFITLGQVIAYIVGWAFSTYGSPATGWRWMVGLGALPAILQGGMIAFMPETPRWLVKVGRSSTAKEVIRRANGDTLQHNADVVIKEIELEVREEQEAERLRDHQVSGRWTWLGGWGILISEGRNRRALAIACLLQGLQQLCGFNSLMYFSATIFTVIGFQSPTLTSMVVAVTNFLGTVAALGLVDRIGRRRVLLYSIPFMIVGLLLSAYGFSFLSLAAGINTTADEPPATAGHEMAALTILVSIMVYVAAYALGLGNVPWMQSELFPLAVRSLGSGVATATSWAANFVVGLTFLPLMDLLSPSWTFVLYAIICGGGYFLVWRIYPETAGLSLEEATALLDDGWGVR
ncbi:hypothetical protein FSPOR_2143 [Fusarium sporotrichioides]|uniref:Major facilitator superfamily (MFS) profile domain-containing protein n=1 Tax=Fusarium sporotrichioides TaxID=5514 RepID=A0A395SLR2_FUSSP|nr:hypothetical protein FSPOR_2143 [Fusarium sporotrichioides]